MESVDDVQYQPYQLLDTYYQTVLGNYWTQDRAMMDLYNQIRYYDNGRCLNLLFIHADESEELLCWGGEQRIIDWYKALQRLTFELRMKGGTDILGLCEFIQYSGLHPQWQEDTIPMHILDLNRYRVCFGPLCGRGATKLEALSRAYILVREAYPEGDYGKLTQI